MKTNAIFSKKQLFGVCCALLFVKKVYIARILDIFGG